MLATQVVHHFKTLFNTKITLNELNSDYLNTTEMNHSADFRHAKVLWVLNTQFNPC